MELNRKHCYDAVRSRDARFDGRFYTGVRTTRIYCRPVCPARTPKAENVTFYACAAAAEEAGFRPCLRCRPETAPGTPAWAGTSATVSRAHRLINDGFLDTQGVEDLAARLGMGPRHLRRLFDEHLGVSPIAVAQSQRVHLARKLLDETSLSITDIALSSGFSSVRRFNSSFKKVYHRAPRDVRRDEGKHRREESSSTLQLKLPFRQPFDWKTVLEFYAFRAIPGVECVEDGVFRRTVCVGETIGLIEVHLAASGDHLVLAIPPELAGGAMRIVERVRRMFDLRADPDAIASVLQKSPTLRSIVRKRPGLRVPGSWDAYEIAVRAILGQQVSVKGARTIAGRIARQFGTPFPGESEYELVHLFPRPEQLVNAPMEKHGLTGRRAETVRGISRAVLEGTLDLETVESLEGFVEQFTELPGVGPWTAHYVAMRALGEPDAFPSGDLVLRKGATPRGRDTITDKALLDLAEEWRPWRAYAAIYLWAKAANMETKKTPKKTKRS